MNIRSLSLLLQLILLTSGLTIASSTSASEAGRSKAHVIFDTDMSDDCDDAGALAVLHALADRGEAEILAIVTNIKCPANASAVACSAINHFYQRPHIPIGTDKDGAKTITPKPSRYTPALRDEFPHSAKPDDQMPDSLALLRKTLAAQPDQSVTYLSVGALSNMEDLLHSGPDEHSPLTGRELISAKIRHTVIMGGAFPTGPRPETNIRLDVSAAITVVNLWPVPILWQGYEVGASIITGTELQGSSTTNPVRRAFELRPFKDQNALALGKPSHDQAAVLLAVRGPEPELWNVHDDGRPVFNSDGFTEWVPANAKKHRYVSIKDSAEALRKLIGQLMSEPPQTQAAPQR